MPQHSLSCAALLAVSMIASPAALRAQQTTSALAPANDTSAARATAIGIPAVAGLPFSTTVVIETDRTLPNGSVYTRRTINVIARDSAGRTHNEVRRLMPESFHGSPEVLEVHLYDPQTRTRTTYYPASHLAQQQVLPAQPSTTTFPNPWLAQEDLGTITLNGFEANGTRHRYVVSDVASGTGKRIDVVDETWYAPALHLNLLAHHTDPRSGEQIAAVSAIKRDEPPAAMFELPAGYKIENVNPSPAPVPASVNTAPAARAPAESAIP
jgi:hypothetical protein